jgi:hypothetical protein
MLALSAIANVQRSISVYIFKVSHCYTGEYDTPVRLTAPAAACGPVATVEVDLMLKRELQPASQVQL